MLRILFIFFFLIIGFSGAWAENFALLSFGAGANSFLKKHHRTPIFRLEYKGAPRLSLIRPIFGVDITAKRATYFYTGLQLDLVISHLAVCPNITTGYFNKGKGKNLGFPLEFRTGIEIAYRFCNCSRLGVSVSHISNASLSRKNPGDESIVLFYAFPI